ncbi:TetR/AcrR family transcriptional regulator [Jongsikchunia kroppenstedtii]|uniref:TetR/AcrR family transcriptional regulator n=1 Tax=Jongsikchunia kroppenstedtii TaxID=1121721 RepID=UPI00037335BA|nr:TetR/AcrR family transcriptional regulator [Jongsikchunia kroppenstedtii]
MASLTRAERQARTRADLLQVAQQRFLADGYTGASLDAIAEAAGYSKGAVYSNFTDKRSLCAAVLDNIHHQKVAEIEAIVATDAPLADRVERINEWLEHTVGDVGWTRLEMEFAAGVWRDEELAAMEIGLRRDMKQQVAAMLQTLATELGVTDERIALAQMSIDDMAELVLSTGIGLGIQRAVDPTVSVAPAVDAVRLVVGMLSMLGGAASGAR